MRKEHHHRNPVNRALHRLAVPASLSLVLALQATAAAAGDSATIVMYPNFADEAAGTSAIKLEQFDAHLKEITSGKYAVLPLPEIIAALKEHRPLPDRALAITIDEAHLAIYTEAWPRLRRAGLPFTLFVATDPVDTKAPGYMSWDQVRELARSGVVIGNLTSSEPHMTEQEPARAASEIAAASQRIKDEIGTAPTLFAYPYGEWGSEIRQQVIDAGFAAAFGQQSGVTYGGSDWYSLPRFVMSEAYGGLERFRLAASALPLRVRDVTPEDPVLRRNPPALGFTVLSGNDGLDRLACFASNQSGPTQLERLGEGRIEIRVAKPFPPGRSRVNCTMPGPDDRWRWFGLQLYVPMPH